MANYKINVPIDGYDISLFTVNKLKVTDGYNRIVIGRRGPYVEFTERQLIPDSFFIPRNQLYRLTDKRVYYIEFRSNDAAHIKLYYQLQTVAYADYKIGMFYISPYDLYTINGDSIVTSKVILTNNKKAELFFT
jgi:hypothetical protein